MPNHSLASQPTKDYPALTLVDFSLSASIADIFLRSLPNALASTAAPLRVMEQGPWGVEGCVCSTHVSAYMPLVLGLNWKLHNSNPAKHAPLLTQQAILQAVEFRLGMTLSTST